MKKIIVILFLFTIFSMTNKKDQTILIPDTALRFRVIANSNTIEDQVQKLQIKEELEKKIYEQIKGATTTEDAKEKLKENILELKTLLEQKGVDYKINLGLNYFPEKEYRGITYEQGYYDSLVITLGKGQGDNWWCVLFPPLCLIDAKEEIKDDVEYRSYVIDTLKKFQK